MKFNLILVLLLPLFCLGVDWYILLQLKKLHNKFLQILHISLSVLLYGGAISAICLVRNAGNDAFLVAAMWLLFTFFAFYIPKFLYTFFSLLGKLPILFKKKEIKPLNVFALIIGVVVFILFWWEAIVNRYRLDVVEHDIEIPDLPECFNGYKVVQISDLHVGSYLNNTHFIDKIVKKINSLNPDVILLTGDIVTRHSEELRPFLSSLSQLHPSDGAYAVLGNHDYGLYFPEFDNESEQMADVYNLREFYKATAFKLLSNESCAITRGKDSLIIIGVENIARKPFPTYGSLETAYPTLSDSLPKILMSHDPSHWEDSIMNNDNVNIALTLSGHTHAMQAELFGWSPASLVHRFWGGLYKDKMGKQLYVNIGTGTVGMPARIGATPEITLFILHPSKK